MLEKSEGLFLKKLPYGDHSAVLSIFTPQRGLITFMGRNLNGKSSKNALFEPGRFLEIIYFYKSNKNFQQLKEVHLSKEISPLHLNPWASQILQFCSEVIFLTIREGHADEELFYFSKEQIALLCKYHELAWFPQQFLLLLAKMQGFEIFSSKGAPEGIHVESGQHISGFLALGEKYITSEELQWSRDLISGHIPQMNKQQKSDFTEKLIRYTEKHVLNDQEIKSYPVLKELMNA